MKSLLISLMALLCALGVYAAPTGSGTQEDPYVIADGDTSVIPQETTVYASFTAPADGTLKLTHGWSWPTFMVDGNTLNVEMGMDGNFSTLSVKAGQTYLIYNHSLIYGIEQDINVSFAEAGANALTIVSSEPEQGAKLEKIDWENPVKVTLNKKVKYVHYAFSGDDGIQHEYYISEAEDGEDVLNVGPSKIDLGDRVLDNAWYMYEGSSYEVKIEAYKTEAGMYQGTETPEVATLTFEGATPRETKTAVNILSVDPEPNIYTPTADQCLSFKDNRRTVTIVVDKEVKVKSVVVPMGMYGTKDWGTFDVKYEDGHSVITAVLDESNMYDPNFKLTTDIILQIKMTDMDGNEVVDGGEGKYGNCYFNSGYEFSFGVLDGRYADASLMYESTTPAADSYNASLSQVELNYGSFVMLTSTASAALYKDDVKVADAKLSANTDENKIIAKFVEIGTDTPKEINEFGAYVLKVDSQSIANEYFDELAPWSDGLQGHGICNPDYEITFNVDPASLSVVSIDPAPYVEGGEFNKEIPSEINITLSGEGATVRSAMATYGMNTRVLLDSKVEGNVITLTVPESALTANSISISVSAVNANETPISYQGNGFIQFMYQMPKNILVPVEVTPADGSTVTSLSNVVLTVNDNDGAGRINTDNLVTVKKDGAESNISANIDYAPDSWNQFIISFDSEITENGTYTITIPEGTLFSLDDNLYNPELTYTFIVNDGTSAIDGVESEDANAYVKVYSIDGTVVCKGKKADVVKSLKKGIYIINGQKVVIR